MVSTWLANDPELASVCQLRCARKQGRDQVQRFPFAPKGIEQCSVISQEGGRLLQHKLLDLVRGKAPTSSLNAICTSVDLMLG